MSRTPIFLSALSWLFVLAAAAVPYAGLRALGMSLGYSAGAAACIALVLPVSWHLAAERRRSLDPPSRTSPATRLGLRAAFVSALVLAGALMTTGPVATWAMVMQASPLRGATQTPSSPSPSSSPHTTGPSPEVARGALEALVPADATVVVSSAGAAPLRELLARGRGDVEAKLDALAKCGVRIAEAAWLVAARGADRVIAARIPGADEDRNLYCVAGVLADAGVRMALATDTLTINGLLDEGALTFRRVDRETLLLADGPWRFDVEQRAAGQGAPLADGGLRSALARVDRRAPVWAIGELRGGGTAWDLALDGKLASGRWQLRASSVSRDTGERAEATVNAPPSFAAVLPRGGLVDGAAGLFAIVAGTPAVPRVDAATPAPR